MIRKSKPIKTILGITVGLVVTALTSKFIESKISENTFEKELEKINEGLPRQIDDLTLMDSVKMISANELNYFFTIDEENIDWEQFDRDLLNKNLLHTIKTEQSLDALRKKDFTWKYIYYGNRKNILHEYTITPDMYK